MERYELCVLLALGTGLLACQSPAAEPVQLESSDRQQAVLALAPVGYWPADDGAGDVLHDRSGNGNHGSLKDVPWAGDLLDFTGAYQWADIPDHPAYQSRSFAIGGWVFNRGEIRGGAMGREGVLFIGNAYHRSGFRLETLYDHPVLYRKSEWGIAGGSEGGVSLCLRRDGIVDVISGGAGDAIGSRAAGAAITIGAWQHVLYTYEAGTPVQGDEEWKKLQDFTETYEAGTGRLYVNGRLAQSKEAVHFERRDMRFLIGPDAYWWLQSNQSGSLDGSIRDIVMFDRALLPEEVARLHEATRPAEEPRAVADEADVVDTHEITEEAVPPLVETLQDKDMPRGERVESILALAGAGVVAKTAVPALVAELEDIVAREGAHLPRVEDLLRNALMRALLDIDREDERARDVLGAALARPIFDSLDLSLPYLDEVRPLVAAGHYMAALDVYRALPLKEHDDRFISQGDPHRDDRGHSGNDRAYTAVAEHDGYVYRLGAGKSFNAVEAVSDEDFKAAVAELAVDYPEVEDWMRDDTPRISRLRIYRTDAAGNEQTAFLEGEHFIFDARDGKVRGWSIAVDQEGHLHVTGGKHNAPNAAQYIPGSWERMGAARSHTDDDYPTMLYWVSRKPGDIESLEFVGQRRNPRNIPAPLGMCYMTFTQDRDRVLYLYGRIHVQGIQSWGFYRYDVATRRWQALGGFAPDVKAEYPEWADQNIEMAADWLSLATFRWKNTASQNRVLAWALQPHFYNYIRGWGIQFDRANRMHVQVGLFGFDNHNRNVHSELYAYSDDGGESFHRADGTVLGVPLTVTPGEPGYAAMDAHSTRRWWNLWMSLLREAGY